MMLMFTVLYYEIRKLVANVFTFYMMRKFLGTLPRIPELLINTAHIPIETTVCSDGGSVDTWSMGISGS